MYSVKLRFPLVRSFDEVFYYLDADGKDYPVGYFVRIAVTTTNVVDGFERLTFTRTPYSSLYYVFVDYPIDISCYKNVQILNWYVLLIT